MTRELAYFCKKNKQYVTDPYCREKCEEPNRFGKIDIRRY